MGTKITIIEGNSNDKDQTRNYFVKGADGISPSAKVTRGTGKATLEVTDAEGTTTSDIFDGVSPTVETSKTSGVTTIIITDAEGTHTATINDGATANIIDSSTLSDNTTQTYSGRIIDSKLADVVPEVTTISTTWSSNSSSFTFDLPTGYNSSNFTVLNVYLGANHSMIYNSGTDGLIFVKDWLVNSSNKLVVDLLKTGDSFPTFSSDKTVYAELLKIS